MSRAFGPIFQIAYVVEDLEAQIDHWTETMAVGPFFRFPLPLPFERLEVRGERVANDADIYAGIAVSYSGDTMIELIQPGSAPSVYREFLGSGRRGAHHLGAYVDDLDARLAEARAAGIGVPLAGALPLSRFAYLETDTAFPGTMLELIEPRPAMVALFDSIKAAARDWDGRERTRDI